MSPILINSTNPTVVHKSINCNSSYSNNNSADEEKGEEETEKAREERKQTGRSIAIIIFLSLMCLALYHIIQRKTTILAGVLVPALILFSYTFFVIHISNRDKKRRKKLEADELLRLSEQSKADAAKKAPLIIPSPLPPLLPITALPSTSGKHSSQLQQSKSSKSNLKRANSARTAKTTPNGSANKLNASTGVKRKGSLKKIPSHSHIQVKSNQSAAAHITIENEIKKLKKSRSFDKNNHHIELARQHLAVDNKKSKTKR